MLSPYALRFHWVFCFHLGLWVFIAVSRLGWVVSSHLVMVANPACGRMENDLSRE